MCAEKICSNEQSCRNKIHFFDTGHTGRIPGVSSALAAAQEAAHARSELSMVPSEELSLRIVDAQYCVLDPSNLLFAHRRRVYLTRGATQFDCQRAILLSVPGKL